MDYQDQIGGVKELKCAAQYDRNAQVREGETMAWIVTYNNPAREDSHAVFKSEKNALLEALRLIETLHKDEREGLEWEEGDELLELLNDTAVRLKDAKNPKADIDVLRDAYESWQEYVSESGHDEENVTVEEADRGD